MPHASLRLTPHGHLVLKTPADAAELDERTASRLTEAFARGSGQGLLRLGAGELGPGAAAAVPVVARLCRPLCRRAVPAIIRQRCPDAPPSEADLASLVLTAPMMTGAEYLTTDVLRALWQEIAAALAASLAAAKTDLQSFLKGLNPAWNLVGRVHFNLAENRARRRCTVRVSRHLHDAALGAGAGAARAARPGAARICRRGQSR